MKKHLRQEKLYNFLLSLSHSVSIDTLAERYECCQKTIRRDIEEIAEFKKSPWYIHDNKIYIDKERKKRFQLEDGWLSNEELSGLLTLYHSVENLSNGALQLLLNPVKERLLGALEQGNQNTPTWLAKIKIIEAANRRLNPELFHQLHNALAQSSAIQLQYWKRSSNQQQTRTVSPQQLVRYKDNWYLDAYCHQAKALRSFALDAINSVKLCPDQNYQALESSQIQNHFQQSYGIFSGQAEHTATLHFNEYISRWIQNETWHPDQILEKQPDGSLIMHLPYHHDIELIQDILKYGANVQVLSPLSLQSKIAQQLEEALRHYRSE